MFKDQNETLKVMIYFRNAPAMSLEIEKPDASTDEEAFLVACINAFEDGYFKGLDPNPVFIPFLAVDNVRKL